MKYDFKNIYEWPPKLRFAVIGVVGLIVFIAGYHWDLSTANSKLDTSRQQENELIQQLTLIYKNKASTKADIGQLPQLNALLNQWQGKLVTHTGIPDVLDQILKLGANNDLYFSLFNPEDAVPDTIYEKIPIKTMIVGDYFHLAQFLSQVANLPWLVAIGDFVISTENKNDALGAKLAEKANAQNLLTAEITFFVYYRPERKPDEKPKPA